MVGKNCPRRQERSETTWKLPVIIPGVATFTEDFQRFTEDFQMLPKITPEYN